MTAAPLILLFFTNAPDLGFKPGYGLELGLTHPNFELRLSAAHQPKYNADSGYTYASSLQLHPAWSVAPSIGYTCFGYHSTWSKQECTAQVGIHAHTQHINAELVALRTQHQAQQAQLTTTMLNLKTTLTSTLFLHTSIDYTTPINAMGYTLGIGWKKSPNKGAKERRR